MAHWSLSASEPALISLPTGAGKTGVALAAPFLTPVVPERILVLVPSRALREQTVAQFADLKLLQSLGAISTRKKNSLLRVHEVTGTSTDWTSAGRAEVVVAIPQSISPASESQVSVPPSDFFDLVIVDEAHHAPSRTWTAILDHLEFSSALLLTATPFRLDKKPVPGTNIFHFPLRAAIEQGFYKPVRPLVLPRPEPFSNDAKDQVILEHLMDLAQSPEHQTSAILVRASNIGRAEELALLYSAAGLDIEALTTKTSYAEYEAITERLRDGSLRAVSVVGMLGEGFDLPRLRLVAYHDKHKSVPATVQLVGRLARVTEDFPQDSVLVTVDDGDVYPELQSVVRDLYREDADWATILPGIVDAEVEADKENRGFIDSLQLSEGTVDPLHLQPMPTPSIYELRKPRQVALADDGTIPEQLEVGQSVGGAQILTALVGDAGDLIVLVTRRRFTPKWCTDQSVESVEYGISAFAHKPSPRTELPSLLFVDAADGRIAKAVLEHIDIPEDLVAVEPDRIDRYLQSLPRTSVSSIGMRNILAGTSGTTYKTRAGRSTDTDLLSTETTQTSLGHVMMQIHTTGGGSTTVGAAFEKGKIWQRRYKSLADYAAWVAEAAELLWFPRTGGTSPLLPQVPRGRNVTEWPIAAPIAVEMHPAVSIGGYQLMDSTGSLIGPIEDFDLHAGFDPTESLCLPAATPSELPAVGTMTNRAAGTQEVCWAGTFFCGGSVTTHGQQLTVKHGYAQEISLDDFLAHYPPMVYFASGQAVQGRELFDVQGGSRVRFDYRNIEVLDWTAAGVDIFAETRKAATDRGLGVSIHEATEQYLRNQPRRAKYRWILCNDGAGEIADHLVIEHTPPGVVYLSLWHSKAAGGEPSLRVNDFQVVIAQALRSRSWFNNPLLWDVLRNRISGRQSPAATLVEGSDSLARLLVYLGEQRSGGRRRKRSWRHAQRLVSGEIAIVQPGLKRSQLLDPADSQQASAESLHQLLAIFADTIATTGGRGFVLAS